MCPISVSSDARSAVEYIALVKSKMIAPPSEPTVLYVNCCQLALAALSR